MHPKPCSTKSARVPIAIFAQWLSHPSTGHVRRSATCAGRLPSGAVHGDAHLEQFVVTDDDFGLADFDSAGYGPAIVDLVRYAASLHLACRESKAGAIRNKP